MTEKNIGQGPWSVWVRMKKGADWQRKDTYRDFEVACELADEWVNHLRARTAIVRDAAHLERYRAGKEKRFRAGKE
jgi:hypothetical protein